MDGLSQQYFADFDLVIENGTIIDPKRELCTIANVAVKDQKIALITRADIKGKRTINAKNKIVSPGFIDFQSHVDGNLYSAQSMINQGATTTIGGNSGNINDALEWIKKEGFPINQGFLVSHSSTLRPMVGLSDPYRSASQWQIDKMVSLAEEMLDSGALGVSSGLEFVPGSSIEELRALARMVAKYGKVMPIHIRRDGWDAFKALHEVIQLSEETGVAIQFSHLTYMVGMGMMAEALSSIDKARKCGLDVMGDAGVYSAFPAFIGTVIFDEGWQEKYDCRYEDLLISSGIYIGKRCTKILFDELRQSSPNTLVTAFVGETSEIIEALKKDYMFISTNAAVGSHQPGTGHPQDIGTFPRILGRYVRELKVLSIMEAIKKITYLPAKRFGLNNKGWLGVGADADLTVFDPNLIIDQADYLGYGIPDKQPKGIDYVIVNGTIVVENGILKKSEMPGNVINPPNKLWMG